MAREIRFLAFRAWQQVRKREPTRAASGRPTGRTRRPSVRGGGQEGSKMAPNQAGLLAKEEAYREVMRAVGVCPKAHMAEVVIVMTLEYSVWAVLMFCKVHPTLCPCN